DEIDRIMARARAEAPGALGGLELTDVVDHAAGGGLMPTDALEWVFDGVARVVLRPSGTEPKAKCYMEVLQEVSHGDVASGRRAAAAVLGALRADLAERLQIEEGTAG